MGVFDELDERGLLIVPRLSANEAERLFPVADGGQRADNFRDERSSAEVIRLRRRGQGVHGAEALFRDRLVLRRTLLAASAPICDVKPVFAQT
jgi:hypothetical protein